MRTGKLKVARREMHIARANENNMRNQLRARVDKLRAENAELSRLITEVAIPALDYSTRNRIGVLSLEPVQYALATLQEAVK